VRRYNHYAVGLKNVFAITFINPTPCFGKQRFHFIRKTAYILPVNQSALQDVDPFALRSRAGSGKHTVAGSDHTPMATFTFVFYHVINLQ
jgi:hypothetical protein